MTDHLRGHPIHQNERCEWVYTDTGEPTVDTWRDRPCGHCGLGFTDEGHDGCLGTLPGVMNACCGHGELGEAYVQMSDGSRLSGDKAMAFFREHGRAMATKCAECGVRGSAQHQIYINQYGRCGYCEADHRSQKVTTDTTILEKFERLRAIRASKCIAYCPDCEGPRGPDTDGVCIICESEQLEYAEALASELEAWARQAPAGRTLNTICATWMGWRIDACDCDGNDVTRWKGADSHTLSSSTTQPTDFDDPAAAMELLEAMFSTCPDLDLARGRHGGKYIRLPRHITSFYANPVHADGLRLLVARACACLAARGIERSEGVCCG